MLVDIVARDAKLLRRIQCERGVPGLVKRFSAELKLFETHSSQLGRRRWLEVKSGT
jgi:hypothetical protein